MPAQRAIAASASGSQAVSPNTNSASALGTALKMMLRTRPGMDWRVARYSVDTNAPQPAAPHSQPSVRAHRRQTHRGQTPAAARRRPRGGEVERNQGENQQPHQPG